MQVIKKFFLSMLLFSSSTLFCIEPINATICIINFIIQGYWVGKDVYQIINPTSEQQLNAKTAEEKLKYVVDEQELNALVIKKQLALERARSNFKNCLSVSVVEAKRDIYNSPINCKEILDDFVMCGGEADAIVMVRNFDKIHTK